MNPVLVTTALVASQMLDAGTTLWITHGLAASADVEGNPISRTFLAGDPLGFILLKLFGALLASLLIIYAQKKRPNGAKKVLLISVSIGIVAAVLNSYSIALLSFT